MFHIINADGTETFVRKAGEPVPEEGCDMAQVREIIGGFAEPIALGWGVYMLVDEDAKMKASPPPLNAKATALWSSPSSVRSWATSSSRMN